MTGLFNESEEFCNYALALSTFSLLRTPSAPSSPIITRMVAELKTRIVNSKDCELNIISIKLMCTCMCYAPYVMEVVKYYAASALPVNSIMDLAYQVVYVDVIGLILV